MSRMDRILYWFGSVVIGACGLAGASAYSDEASLPEADEVVAKFNARDEGEHVRRIVTMTLRNKHGKERVRQALSCRKFYGTEKRTVFFFLSPASVRDTAFLTFDYGDANQEDDQWLYLPAARKVRRISSGDRGDFFVGTDFTYEDIKKETKISAEDFTFKFLGTEVLDGHRCFKVEATPINKSIAKELGYARAVHWFDGDILIAHKSEFNGKDGRLLRTILTSEIEQIDGIWTAQCVTAKNELTGHSTEFRFSGIDYDEPVKDSMFAEQALARGPGGH